MTERQLGRRIPQVIQNADTQILNSRDVGADRLARQVNQLEQRLSDLQAQLDSGVGRTAVLWAEQFGALQDNTEPWTFGQGASGVFGAYGIPLLEDWELYGMSVQAASNTGPFTINAIDRTANAFVGSITSTGTASAQLFAAAATIPSGNVLGFRTTVSGGATDVRVAAWLRRI